MLMQVVRKRIEWTADPKYVDWYERALVNGILGTQKHGTPGAMLCKLVR
jgi:DUF1680 family protein